MKTLLQAIYDDLLHEGKVKSKTDLGEKLGLSRSRISQIIGSFDTLPKTMQEKLNKLYGYSLEWLASNGKQGKMFARDGAHSRDAETDKPKDKGDNKNISEGVQFGTNIDVNLPQNQSIMLNELMRQLRVKDEQIAKKEEQTDRLLRLWEHEKGIDMDRGQLKNKQA